LTAKTAIVADIGDALFGSLDIMVQDTNKFVSDAFYTCMGFAVPAAVGVAMACPDCRPIVLVGDGAFQMTGQEYSTLVRLKIPAIVFVIDNKGFMTERLILDGPFNDVHQWNFEKMADVMGGTGYRVRTVGQLNESVARALESKSPSIIHVELSRGDHSPALKRLFSNLNKKI
jgi:indolepyruvate decarboxylase